MSCRNTGRVQVVCLTRDWPIQKYELEELWIGHKFSANGAWDTRGWDEDDNHYDNFHEAFMGGMIWTNTRLRMLKSGYKVAKRRSTVIREYSEWCCFYSSPQSLLHPCQCWASFMIIQALCFRMLLHRCCSWGTVAIEPYCVADGLRFCQAWELVCAIDQMA